MVIYQSIAGMASLIGILLPLGTMTVIFRFIARYKQKNAFGMDDFLIIPALLSFIGLCILAIYGMADGFIAHPTPTDLRVFLSLNVAYVKVYWIAGLFSVLAVGFTRLSALFFYRRLFVTFNNKWDVFGITTFAAIVVVVLWIVGFAIYEALVCGIHIDWLFQPALAIQCQVTPYFSGVTISSFILDFLILLIPVPKIYMLHTATTRKVAISLVFLLAAAGTAASCVRMVLSNSDLARGRALNDQDTFLANTTLFYFMLLEAGLCLVAINLPSLWYFVSDTALARGLKSMRSRLLSLRSDRSANSKHPYDSDKAASLASHTDSFSSHRDEHQYGSRI